VFEQFCSSRLRGEGGHVFGTLEPSAELKAIVARATVLRRDTVSR
jgi:putative acyl-CoA dehydrogenase